MEALCAVRDRDYELQGSHTEGDDRSLTYRPASLAVGQEEEAGSTRRRNPHMTVVDPPAWAQLGPAWSPKKSPGRRGGVTEGDPWL